LEDDRREAVLRGEGAVRLYFRFTLSLRDVEELLAERGIEVSYETLRCWTIKFWPLIAANLRRRRPCPVRPYGDWKTGRRVDTREARP
jgi:transposase-like protein